MFDGHARLLIRLVSAFFARWKSILLAAYVPQVAEAVKTVYAKNVTLKVGVGRHTRNIIVCGDDVGIVGALFDLALCECALGGINVRKNILIRFHKVIVRRNICEVPVYRYAQGEGILAVVGRNNLITPYVGATREARRCDNLSLFAATLRTGNREPAFAFSEFVVVEGVIFRVFNNNAVNIDYTFTQIFKDFVGVILYFSYTLTNMQF